jgi:hypothetical protein
MVVLQRSREILESERDWRVMEIPFGSVESGVVVGPGRGQALVLCERGFLSWARRRKGRLAPLKYLRILGASWGLSGMSSRVD